LIKVEVLIRVKAGSLISAEMVIIIGVRVPAGVRVVVEKWYFITIEVIAQVLVGTGFVVGVKV